MNPKLKGVLDLAKARLGEEDATALITEIGTALALERQKDEAQPAPGVSPEQLKYEELLQENKRLKHEKQVADFKNSLSGPLGEEQAATIAAAYPANLSEEHSNAFNNMARQVIQAAGSRNASGSYREPGAAPFTSAPLGEKRKADATSHQPPAKTRERALLDECLGFMRAANNRV